ncbi:acyltransferase domain-containing protein [Nocardia sp. CA-290969]|uniref:acyltransferase domain-containing protein n=1 Tax=Nocardia sp. CA-290969 TaxID=3239986 RepID=UPI003D921931
MTGSRSGVVFLFSPDGGEHDRMGRTLAGRYPAFAAAVTGTGDAVVAAGGPRVWTPRHGFRHPGSARWPELRYRNPEFAQPALFTYQVATAALLISWGVRPDAVIGHGLGEVAAAVTAGALSPADAARVAVARGRAAHRMASTDTVAELAAPVSEVRRLVQPVHDRVAIVAVHGPNSVLISGPQRAVDTVVRRAERRGIATTHTTVFSPAHAHPAAAAALRAELGPLRPVAPKIPIYSTARRGAALESAAAGVDYWIENFTGTADLDAALERAQRSGATMVLEVGPDPVLCGAVRAAGRFAHNIYPTAHRDDEGTTFLTCLAQVQVVRATASSRREAAGGPDPGRPDTAGTDDRSARGTGNGNDWAAATSLESKVTEPGDRPHPEPGSPGIDHTGRDMRAEVAGAGTLASIRHHNDLPPTDIIAWTRMVDANRAIRFLTARVALDSPMPVDTAGTYVVSGGLGALGSVVVRRLLVSGARDVLVPTRSPRPVPPLLDGFEDRVVVVRCDTADRLDLDNALRDIRESGCTIRGVVHAAQVFEDTAIAAMVTADGARAAAGGAVGAAPGEPRDPIPSAGRLARRFARISPAAANLLELTAADPVAFFAVFSTPFGGVGTAPEPAPVSTRSWMHPG